MAIALRVDWHLAFRQLPLYTSPAIDEALHWEWAQQLARGAGSPERPYFRAPLYPWWLGLAHAAGLGIGGLRWLGTGLGMAGLLLLSGIGLRWQGSRPALALLALGGLSGAWIYYEPQLLLEHQVLLLLLGASAAWLSLNDHPPGWRDGLFGLALAGAALTRPNALLLAPLAFFLLWHVPTDRERRLVRLGAFLLGWLPPVMLVAGLNGWPQSGVLVASQGGVNLWIGNNPAADGASAVLPGTGHAWERADATRQAAEALGHPPTPGEEDAWFRAKARAWTLEHPGQALRLALVKLGWLLGPEELGNNTSPPTLASRRAWMSLLLSISWWAVALPGLLGLALGLPRSKPLRLWVLGALVIYAGSFLPFFITGRFRLPLLGLLAYPAAELASLAWRREFLRAVRPWRWTAAGCVILVFGAAWGFQASRLGPGERAGQRAWQEFQLGNAWLRQQQADSARASYLRALRASPRLPEVRLNLGLVEARRSPQVAESLFLEELRLDPASGKAWNNLGSLRLAGGNPHEAARCFREALRLRPGLEDAAWNLGLALSRTGLDAVAKQDWERARAALGEALGTPYRGTALARLAAALATAPDRP